MTNLSDFVTENTDMEELKKYLYSSSDELLTALGYFNDLDYVLSLFANDKYVGNYISMEEWGEEQIGEFINADYHSYVDFKKYAKDRELEGRVKFLEHENGYFVFNLEP